MEQIFPVSDILYIEYTDVNKCKIVDHNLKVHPQNFGIKQAWEYYGDSDRLFRVDRKLIVSLIGVLHVNPNNQLLVMAPDQIRQEHVELKASTDALRKLMNLIVKEGSANQEKILLFDKEECFWFYQKEILYLVTWTNVNRLTMDEVQGMTDKPMSMIRFMNGHMYKSPFRIDESDQAINRLEEKRKARCSKICLVNVDQISEINIPKQKMWLTDVSGQEYDLSLSRRALQLYQEKKDGNHRFAEFLTPSIIRQRFSRYTEPDAEYMLLDITDDIDN